MEEEYSLRSWLLRINQQSQSWRGLCVARRGHRRRTTLVVRITFEPSRVSPACVVQAYERVVPITRRPTPQARGPQQAEGAPQTQHVGRRQHA